MTGCISIKEITGSVQEKNGAYYVVVALYETESSKASYKWLPTGLRIKDHKKREAESLCAKTKVVLNGEMDLENSNIRQSSKKLYDRLLKMMGSAAQAGMPADASATFSGAVSNEQAIITMPAANSGVTGYPGDHITVAQYFRDWLCGMENKVEPNTFSSYKIQTEKRIIAYFSMPDEGRDKLMLSQVKPYHVNAFYNWCKEQPRLDGKPGIVSNSTIRRAHANLCKGFNDAVRLEIIDHSPVAPVEVPKNNTFKAKPHSAAEVQKFLEAVKGDLCEVPLVLMFFYGMRRSEALGIKESAVDFENDLLVIQHKVVPAENGVDKRDILKTKKSRRTLPLIPEMKVYLQAVLERHKKMRTLFGEDWNKERYVCVKDDGVQYTPFTVSRHYGRVCEKAGIEKHRLHDSRHTVASTLVKAGHNLKVVQRWLGHSTIQTTGNLYSHLETEDLFGAAETMSVKHNVGVLPTAV